jgi:subtilisin
MVKVCSSILLMSMMSSMTMAQAAENRRRIVAFAPGTPLLTQRLIVLASGSLVVHTLSLIDAIAIELPLGGGLGVVEELLSHVEVVAVYNDPVGVVDSITALSPGEVPQDEGYQWGQTRIGIPLVHAAMPLLQGSGVTIAILDTGIDRDHPELQQNIAGGYCTVRGETSYEDDNGHGTHIAGIIAAADNNQGIIGVAPKAKILAVKVLDRNGQGYVSDLIRGLQWVHEEQVKLVNMSLGFFEESVPLQRATRRLYEDGVIMVASAGNKGCTPGSTEGGGADGEGAPTCDASQSTVKYPAGYWWVIAVAATDVADDIPAYSLSGSAVDMAAPGGAKATEQLLSTHRGGGYGWGSGTSQAAAHVTGAVALALQYDPHLSFARVHSLLRDTAGDLGYAAARQGAGLIAVHDLMEALQ